MKILIFSVGLLEIIDTINIHYIVYNIKNIQDATYLTSIFLQIPIKLTNFIVARNKGMRCIKHLCSFY